MISESCYSAREYSGTYKLNGLVELRLPSHGSIGKFGRFRPHRCPNLGRVVRAGAWPDGGRALYRGETPIWRARGKRWPKLKCMQRRPATIARTREPYSKR